MSLLHYRHGAHLESYRRSAHIRDEGAYRALYRRSLDDPEGFWAEQARLYLDWEKQWDEVHRWDAEEARCRWFAGGVLNAAGNCIDRHLERRRNEVAFYWEGQDPSETETITYGDLHDRVNRLSALLRARGIGKGDRVALYLPMIPALPVSMLACARIGAVHTAVYTGFSPKALTSRMADCRAKALITVDGMKRNGERVPLIPSLRPVLAPLPHLETVLIDTRMDAGFSPDSDREVLWGDAAADPSLPESVPPEPMDAEDPLFILYISGVRGRPKGVVHTHGGYLLHAAMTTRLVLDARPEEVLWCTSDMGWIVGHTYGLYGPLLNGLASVLFEGEPESADPACYGDIIERYGVDRLCWTPTEIRLARNGGALTGRDLPSLKLMASVGEPMDPETWEWAYHQVGRDRRPVIDAYLQTETGGILIAPLPGAGPLKPAFCGQPFFGVEPVVLDDFGEPVRHPGREGVLCIRRPWPGMARTIHNDHERFIDPYFNRIRGMYFTADAALQDADGDFRMLARVDDVIKVCGGRICAAEMEAVLRLHPEVTDAAVVRFPHPVKGEGIYAFVALHAAVHPSDALKEALLRHLGEEIGSIAAFDVIQWTRALPRTRSGKVVRHILDKIAAGNVEDMGDAAAIVDPALIQDLINGRQTSG